MLCYALKWINYEVKILPHFIHHYFYMIL